MTAPRLTAAQRQVLCFVRLNPDAFSFMVEDLAAMGLITRHYHPGEDRLTPAGRAALGGAS